MAIEKRDQCHPKRVALLSSPLLCLFLSIRHGFKRVRLLLRAHVLDVASFCPQPTYSRTRLSSSSIYLKK